MRLILANGAMQLIQQPDKITILYSDTCEFRQVRMNEPHPAHVTPTWYGDSVGHYEGDMLVIDTVGIKVGPFGATDLHAAVDQFGTPHSPALHVIERYRFLDHEAAKVIEQRNEKDNSHLEMVDNGIARDPNYQGKGLDVEFRAKSTIKPRKSKVSGLVFARIALARAARPGLTLQFPTSFQISYCCLQSCRLTGSI
jgi:hypothetical protein